MKVLLLGPQGCGKGTVGKMLSDKYRIPLISSGQALREVPPHHPRYTELHEYMDNGLLAPQDFVASMLRERTSKPDCSNGYIMEGWGRAMIDLKYFDPGYDKVVVLDIKPETTISRLSNRRTCRKCGKVFNIVTVPPKVEGKCDECGGDLYQREDDTESAIKKRLEIYSTETREVVNHFRDKGILLNVDAEPAPEEVFASVVSALNS